jgi:hypothetical protein
LASFGLKLFLPLPNAFPASFYLSFASPLSISSKGTAQLGSNTEQVREMSRIVKDEEDK